MSSYEKISHFILTGRLSVEALDEDVKRERLMSEVWPNLLIAGYVVALIFSAFKQKTLFYEGNVQGILAHFCHPFPQGIRCTELDQIAAATADQQEKEYRCSS